MFRRQSSTPQGDLAADAADAAVVEALAQLQAFCAGSGLATVRWLAVSDRIDWEFKAMQSLDEEGSPTLEALEETIRQRINGLAGYLTAVEALEDARLMNAVLLAVRRREALQGVHDLEAEAPWWMPATRRQAARELLHFKLAEIRRRS